MSEPGKGDDCFELESSMAESRLRAPDLGVSRCLGKCQKNSPGARKHPFSGKSFYLDLPAGKNLQFLTGAIQQLGGVIEGFLSKEVSYIVSSRREVKAESSGKSHRGCPSPSPSEVRVETSAMVDPKGSHPRPSRKPVDLVPLSRGKELLQKAIRNQGSISGGGSGGSSSLLTNARSWGVRILHVDEMMMHVQQLSLASLCVKKQQPKKPEGTCPAAESRTRKVARLKAPFLKIEDESRKFRPLHHQFKSFPEISFLGPKDASPFEAPTTLGSMHHTRESKDGEPSPRSAARTMPRRKKGYCECCQEAFEELHVHLQSAQHRSFALEAHLYAEVDRIIAQLSHSFADIPFQAGLPRWSGSPASDCDPLCPETLHPHQPSHPRAASPRIRKEDSCQASVTQGRAAGQQRWTESLDGGMGPPASHTCVSATTLLPALPKGSREQGCLCPCPASFTQSHLVTYLALLPGEWSPAEDMPLHPSQENSFAPADIPVKDPLLFPEARPWLMSARCWVRPFPFVTWGCLIPHDTTPLHEEVSPCPCLRLGYLYLLLTQSLWCRVRVPSLSTAGPIPRTSHPCTLAFPSYLNDHDLGHLCQAKPQGWNTPQPFLHCGFLAVDSG
ncbi:protein DBF4 homolog B isoform X6 [Pan paniscus]|uniref:protein DBF4 homolog B isoform X6 n=1 Tax=Pan paniscus TaxID=9597 RepID=UPI003005D5C2